MPPDDTHLAAHRYGFGPLGARGPLGREELLAELARPGAARLPDPLPDAATALRRFAEARAAINQALAEAVAARREAEAAGQPAPARTAPPPPSAVALLLLPEIEARFARLLSGEADFTERLVLFWANHFAVSAAPGGALLALVGPFEREAIRPHVTGRFRDMLQAAAAHPAMLAYLTNTRSIGPNSPAGRRTGAGLNENLAREILELHTLGVDGGYTQADVRALAEALTGWTIGGPNSAAPGRFLFNAPAHEPGPRTVLGRLYPEGGEAQGRAILEDLARHPATARHIARKLAAHFVADDPPPALVDRLAATFQETEGDLAALARALLLSPEAWAPERRKLRSPLEFLIAAVRTSRAAPSPQRLAGMLANLGQPPFRPSSPKGFPDRSEEWLAPDAIKTRADFALELAAGFTGDPRALAREALGAALTDETATAIRRAETPRQGLAILLMAPEFQRR